MNEHVETNRANWNERVASHVEAYGARAFADDPAALSTVVAADAERLRPFVPGGSVAGLTLAHLQCHIGTDTLSWARLGADVTGIDFSSESLAAARDLAGRAGIDARFVESTVDDAADAVGEEFDIVYTSVGVLPWLPRLDTWARSIARLLKPGGVFFVRDTHPLLHMLDGDRPDRALVLERPYFETDHAVRYDHGMTYADDSVRLEHKTTYEWTHSLSEILGSVLGAGLRIESFQETRTIAWQAHPVLVEAGPASAGPGSSGPGSTGPGSSSGEFAHPSDPDALPLEFVLVARKPG